MNIRMIAMVIGFSLAFAVVWLLLGSRIVLVTDRIFPGPRSPKEIGRLSIDADSFVIGSRKWPFTLKVGLDRREHLVVYAEGHTLTFGPVKTRWANKAGPEYQFVPAPGDTVRFTRDVSRFGWQTPFLFSLMGGSAPSRHRYAYDRLHWAKASGATLDVTWRDEQVPNTNSVGWNDQYNIRMTMVSIRVSSLEKMAADYLASVKGWTGGDYRLEVQEPNADSDIVHAIYLQDETGGPPGAGKSVALRVHRSTKKVSETAWQ